ncbi:MAG TPA: zf-HC2 domain-containing protein [Candidatus Limnocylindrales bacterium]
MCYEDGRLTAYLDGEVAPEERAEIAAHAETCPDCAANVARLEEDRAVAAEALVKLQPTAEVVSLDARRDERRASPPARRWGRAQIAAVAVAALVIASFAIAPIRNAAANLLQVFRVQKIQTVSISQADLQSIGAALEKGGHVDLQAFGEAWIDGAASEPAQVTLAEAQAAVDFPIKLPKNQSGDPALYLQKAQTYRFKLHVAAINDALKTYGSDRTLPAALDEKVFEVSVPEIVLARYGTPAGGTAGGPQGQPDGIYVGQAHSPELVVPDGVDAASLRDVLLNLPFLPQNVRDQLAAVTDWQSTLLIPNVDGTAHDVSIDGVKAVVISPKSAARDARKKATMLGPITDTTTVIWNDNGVVRAVGGPIDEGTAIALAKSTME